MHQYDPELLLAKWAENDLNDAEQQAFEQLCQQDADFAQRIAQFEAFESMANQYAETPVPPWQFEMSQLEKSQSEKSQSEKSRVPQGGYRSFNQRNSQGAWWQNITALTALATSCAAILLVTLNLRVEFNQDGLLIGTANSYTEAEIQQLLDTELQKYQQTQQAQLQRYANQLQQQQQLFSEQLSAYVLSANRQERKEDFAELIKFVNEQRSDDQIYFARQLNQIQQDLDTRLPSPTWQTPINP